MKNIKLEIKNRWTGNVLFECESKDNTIKKILEKAVKGKIYLEGANLERAYLEGAYLEGAYLEGANLEGANLRGAYLEGAYLKGANLKGANLEGAYLEETYLEEANLEGANLEGAYLKVSDEEINADEIIKNIENNSNLIIKEYYINRNIIPTRWNCFWKYGLVICNWKIKSEEKENSNIEHISNEFIQQLKDENVKHIAHRINEIINYLQKNMKPPF